MVPSAMSVLLTPSAVEGGHRAVMFSRLSGIQVVLTFFCKPTAHLRKDRVVGEGTHLMVPWLHRPEIFSIRVKARPIVSLTGTKGTLCHARKC
jgi:hypothetical protein